LREISISEFRSKVLLAIPAYIHYVLFR
jgi:hypothetical protein